MTKKLKNKYLILPSTFSLKNNSNDHILDINALFWDYILSKKNISEIFNKYIINIKDVPESKRIYFEFILKNLEKIKKIAIETEVFPYQEKRILYYFKIYYFILTTVNINHLYKGYWFSLSLGILMRDNITNIEKYISEKSNFLNIFFDKILENSFFEDDVDYVFQINLETQLHLIIILSNLLKKRFTNIKITINLERVDEQADYSNWATNRFIKQYTDKLINVYYEDNSLLNDKKLKYNFINYKMQNKIYNLPDIKIRLFNTKCFWHKCTFCTINSKYKSTKVFDSLNNEAKVLVDRLIKKLSNINDYFFLYFSDEAIESSILIYFAEQLINNNIKLFWSARTRFSSNYNNKNCKILGKSGLRFLGFGLESTNARIIKLMNKRDRIYSKKELNQILKNCDKNNINPHNYVIIGFPSETKKETQETLDFIKYNLKHRRFYTYFINIFSLNKGSIIYNNPDRFNIRLNNLNVDEKLSFIDYIDHSLGEKYNRDELKYLSHEMYSKIFFKDLKGDYIIGLGFELSMYLIRKGEFYTHKMINNTNPYWNNRPQQKLNNNLLNFKYKILPLIDLEKHSMYVNIINDEIINIDKDLRHLFYIFINDYNSNLTLIENIHKSIKFIRLNDKNKLNIIQRFNRLILKLINDNILYQNNDLLSNLKMKITS